MRAYGTWICGLAVLAVSVTVAACSGNNPPAASGSSSSSGGAGGAGGGGNIIEDGKLQAYSACSNSSECEEDLECVAMLGSQVCAITGCAKDLSCPLGTTCVISEVIHPDGLCAYTGGSTFCARSCRDPLVCNIDPECAAAGCCGDVDASGCPTVCAGLEKMACEIAPNCPASCCGS